MLRTFLIQAGLGIAFFAVELAIVLTMRFGIGSAKDGCITASLIEWLVYLALPFYFGLVVFVHLLTRRLSEDVVPALVPTVAFFLMVLAIIAQAVPQLIRASCS